MTNEVKQIFFNDDLMKGLYEAGFISYKAFLHRDIYLWVTTQVQVRKISERRAIIEAEEKFKLHYNTIYAAVRSFK